MTGVHEKLTSLAPTSNGELARASLSIHSTSNILCVGDAREYDKTESPASAVDIKS